MNTPCQEICDRTLCTALHCIALLCSTLHCCVHIIVKERDMLCGLLLEGACGLLVMSALECLHVCGTTALHFLLHNVYTAIVLLKG